MSVLLTAEQAQQIEEALLDWKENFPNHWDLSDKQALATIRAARSQEQAEQEPEPVCECRRKTDAVISAEKEL